MTFAHRSILAVVLAAASGCANGNAMASNRGRACGPDIRVCPDGTTVYKAGPRCQWQACPEPAPSNDTRQTPPMVPTPPDGNIPPHAPPC